MLENIKIPVKTTVYKKEIYKLKNISFFQRHILKDMFLMY